MSDKKMIWGFLVHLNTSAWAAKSDTLQFDESAWEYILNESVKMGINTIILDIGDGIRFASHPELACEGAWSRTRVRKEIERCKEMGLTLIPKLNFATTHDAWLGEYGKMVSTTPYYQVCNDLIHEVYELFEKPEYIHIGMDEEGPTYYKDFELVIYRQGELFWHDMRYLLDCVHDTGAKPWIWSCPAFETPEEFRKHISAGEVVVSPWQYNALYPEHFTPITSREAYIRFYSKEPYKSMNLTYVEEDPFYVTFRREALPLVNDGYEVVPCVSMNNHCDWNSPDMLRYFKENAPEDKVLGYITAPWFATKEENMKHFEETFKVFAPAKKEIYGK